MLGIIICWHSFFEFLPIQLENIKKNVLFPHQIYIVDNCKDSNIPPSSIPYKYIKSPIYNSNPSDRHQQSLYLALQIAWNECDSFMFLDNDMVFLNPWKEEPVEELIYTPTFRGKWNYCWLNLMYFKKFDKKPFQFSFWTCDQTGEPTDSGGNTGFWLLRPLYRDQIKSLMPPERDNFLEFYQMEYKYLCDTYTVPYELEVFRLKDVNIFHFGKVSNYCNYPEEFQKRKKLLICEEVERLNAKN